MEGDWDLLYRIFFRFQRNDRAQLESAKELKDCE